MLAGGRRATANEIARTLGKQIGAIFGTVGRMRDDGQIDADSDPPTRGTLYWLTDAGRDALEATLAAERPVGRIERDRWVLIVERAGQAKEDDFDQAIGRTDLSAAIDWSVEFGWGWLLAFAPGTEAFQVRRMLKPLEHSGFRCRYASAYEPVAGARLRDQSADLVAEFEEAR